MRGLRKAATSLLALPAAAAAPLHYGSQNHEAGKIGIELHLPLAQGKRPQSLMLMLEESAEICHLPSIHIGQTLLSFNDNGVGSGEVIVHRHRHHDLIIKARWSVSCTVQDEEPVGQMFAFNVDSVDGAPMEVGFAAWLKQTMPTRIEITPLDLQQIGEKPLALEKTTQKGEHRVKLITELEDSRHATPSSSPPPPPSPQSQSQSQLQPPPPTSRLHNHSQSPLPPDHNREVPNQCRSWKCVVQNVTSGLKDTTYRIYKSIQAPGSPGHPHCGPPQHAITQHDPVPSESLADEHHQTIPVEELPKEISPSQEPTINRQKPQDHTKALFYEKPSGTFNAAAAATSVAISNPLPPKPPALLLSLGIAGAAFLLFSFFSLFLLHQRFSFTRRPQISHHHRETREERLARVSARRQRFTTFFRSIFRNLNMFADKDEQQPQYEAAPGGRDLRDDAIRARHSLVQVDDTNMEQELASFRNAASIVTRLIAAEEGRRTSIGSQSTDITFPPMPRYSQDSSPPDYTSDTASLPSYESEMLNTSIVTDGMLYTPGQTAYEPEFTPVTSNFGSDRLGYDEDKE